ncbi:extracellular solute-binding protein [Arthrobacter gandavensis]|uniref:ABC transporter substrate-binding protein n=1 Tax=Arthrobacter gandavensis TaxID=169960 RepID=UPI00188E7A0A|nr:extracellular solute-binding protein [Arthrobacter gandavensis]MBF4993275.1 extracellular solute-binding protein [Arthrobacter gandavensis]
MSLPRNRAAKFSVAAVAAALLLSGCGSDSSADGDSKTLVLSAFPFGAEAFEEAVVKPFEDKTGITVEIETGSNADRLSSLELAGGDSGVDVMLMSDFYAAMGEEKDLFQAVDAEKIPNLENIADFAVSDDFSGPSYSYQLNGVLYRTGDVSAEEAASWDLYGNSDYAGRVAFPDISTTGGQLSVTGVADTYGQDPYDIDAALEAIGGWSPNILKFVSSSTEITNLLVQGEIVASPTLNGFATDLIENGEPVAWTATDEGRYMATNRVLIPSGAKNVDAAHEFIDYLLSTEAQTASAELVGDLPVNPEATVPDSLTAVVGDIAQDPIAAGFSTLDFPTIVANYDTWVDRFAREASSK